MTAIQGSCLCGEMRFECEDSFTLFHLCHCLQCQKATGSAHASNLFTEPDNIVWLKGQGLLQRFDVPGRAITSCFCGQCGSGMPYLSKSGQSLVVPAGCLDTPATIKPVRQIFWAERADWYEHALQTHKHAAMDVDG